MESKDIEAQLKSLIGLDLGKAETGSLPIVKGKRYFSVKLLELILLIVVLT